MSLDFSDKSMTNTIITHFKPLHNWQLIGSITLCCFGILIVWRMIEMVMTDDGELKPFPVIKILGTLAIVILLQLNVSLLFRGMISIGNMFADSILSVHDTQVLRDQLFTQQLEEQGILSFFKIGIVGFFGTGMGIFAKVAFTVLGYLRYFLLTILYIFAPIAFALSMVPMYGLRYLGHYFTTVIQIASWPIFQAILNLIMKTLNQGYEHTDSVASISYIAFMVLYVVCITFIPKIASAVLGGSDFSPISAIAVGWTGQQVKGAGKLAVNAATPGLKEGALAGYQKALVGLHMTSESVKNMVKSPFSNK